MRATRDLYKLLGVSRGTSRDEIRKSHRKLVRQYHPDANPGDRSAEERFKDVQQAYELLSDPQKRREYDAKLDASSRVGPNRSRARASGRTGGEGTVDVDLSGLLSRLADLANDHPSARSESSSRLRGEEVARLAKLLNMDVSRISSLLGSDLTRLSELLGEKIKTNARMKFEANRTDKVSGREKNASARRSSGAGDQPRGKRVKGPKAQTISEAGKGPEGAEKTRGQLTGADTRGAHALPRASNARRYQE